MRIAIISSDSSLYSTNRLKEEARKKGHTVKIVNIQNFSLNIRSKSPAIFYKGKPLDKIDAIIPRIASSQSEFGVAILRQFEQMGVYCLNPSQALTVSRDKLRSMQVLSRHNIEIPETAFVFSRSDILPALEKMGNGPVVIKLLQGSQGAGVMLAESTQTARAIIEAFQVAKHNVLIQKFVSESKGTDIRAFVIGSKVVASMRRRAQDGEFRSNVHRGGSTEAVQLTPEYEQAALLAARIMGLRIAGVDILEGKSGPQILEVNSSPGLEGIEKATNIDIAGQIISYLEEEVSFPYIDITERLSLSKGYSIVEFTMHKEVEFVNKTIENSGLSNQEIRILSITRGGITIPIPPSDEKLLLGDVLLCYGKHQSIKTMLPQKTKRKRKAKNDIE